MHQPVDEVTAPDGAYDISALERKLQEIDTAIRRARQRQIRAIERRDDRTAFIEEAVIDRRLRERLAATS